MWSQCDMVLVLQRIFWSSLFVVVLLWITNISFHGSTSSCTFQKCALQYWQSVTLVAEGRLRTSEWWPWFGMFVGFDMDQVLMWHVVMSQLVSFGYICLIMTMTSWQWHWSSRRSGPLLASLATELGGQVTCILHASGKCLWRTEWLTQHPTGASKNKTIKDGGISPWL